MTPYLKHFSDQEIVIDSAQAASVLNFYFPSSKRVRPTDLNKSDIEFAQALLLAGIDSSYEMGFAEILFRIFGRYVPPSFSDVKDAAKQFAEHAIKHWFRHATGKDLKDPKIYESVRNTLSIHFRSVWAIRQQTGELIY